ncbi:hypothetical protein AGMMS50293_13260 [Spirochaetia bacterium]|nr:hypothetical protein AGMMS50293_13260 [Spirochaetia bacterium]
MSKYALDLDYVLRNVTITDDELREIIAQADAIIEANTADTQIIAEAYLKKAQSLQKMEQFDAIKEPAEKALELCPDMPEALMIMRSYYANKKQYDTALEYVNKALSKKTDYPYGFYIRGYWYFATNDFDKALADFDEAIRLKPDYTKAYERRVTIYLGEKEYDKAIADFTEMIQMNPDDYNLFINRGNAYKSKKEYDNAIEDYNEVLRLKPDFAECFIARGNMYREKEEYDKAIEDYSEALRLKPEDIKGFFHRGLAYSHKTEYDKAIEDYNEALRLKPDSAECFIARGNTYRRKAEYDKAITDINQAIRLKPDFAVAFGIRGKLYCDTGEYDRSITDFNEALRLTPDDTKFYNGRGYAYRGKGEYDKALADFNEALQLEPENGNILDSRGSLYNEKGEYDKAIADFNEALRLDPNFADPYSGRALAFEKKGDYTKAFNDRFFAARLKQTFIGDFFAYIDALLSDTEKMELLWNIPLVQLEPVPHFFANIICGFRKAKLNSDVHKRLVKAVFTFWDQCRCKDDTIVLNQFTNLPALEGMRNSRKLRLFPINYQNDPEEGKVFYIRLAQYLKEKQKPTDFINSLTEHVSEKVAFIRSLTTLGNTLLMWNSSYAAGAGVSIGISSKRINKGQGVGKELVFDEQIDMDEKQKRSAAKTQNKEQDDTSVPFSKMGLYKVFYSEKSINFDENKPLQEIADCIAEFDENAFTVEFNTLLLELFTSIAHLIKDTSYEHEKEYRLLYIDRIMDNTYIQHAVYNGVFDGIHVESEPVLFEDDEIPIYFSPMVDDVTIQKYRHAFMLKGLPLKGSVEKLLRPSGIKFR